MEIEIDLHEATREEQPILANLLQLYLHEFSDYEDDPPDLDAEGRYVYRYLPGYWHEPGRTPFLVRVDGYLAGFALVNLYTHTEQPPGTRSIAEFFVVRKYRRRGVGAMVAASLFDRYPGRWEVAEVDRNVGAQVFWRAVINEYTGGRFEERWIESGGFRGYVQLFASGG